MINNIFSGCSLMWYVICCFQPFPIFTYELISCNWEGGQRPIFWFIHILLTCIYVQILLLKWHKWKQTREGPKSTLLHRWRPHLHRSCWPEARPTLSGHPPLWLCGRWRRWKWERYHSRHSPEPWLSLFHSKTENLEMKEEKKRKMIDSSSLVFLP